MCIRMRPLIKQTKASEKILKCEWCFIWQVGVIKMKMTSTQRRSAEIAFKKFYGRSDILKYSFLPYSLGEWNKKLTDFCFCASSVPFKTYYWKVLGRFQAYRLFNRKRFKLLTSLHRGLIHVNIHNFNHNFWN